MRKKGVIMMKRRKMYNKYRIGDNGQIEKKHVEISPRISSMLNIIAFSNMIASYNEENYINDDSSDSEVQKANECNSEC